MRLLACSGGQPRPRSLNQFLVLRGDGESFKAKGELEFLEMVFQSRGILQKDLLSGEYPVGEVLYSDKQFGAFGVKENEWLRHCGIFGKTGSGKSTIMNLLTRTFDPPKGTIFIDKTDIIGSF